MSKKIKIYLLDTKSFHIHFAGECEGHNDVHKYIEKNKLDEACLVVMEQDEVDKLKEQLKGF